MSYNYICTCKIFFLLNRKLFIFLGTRCLYEWTVFYTQTERKVHSSKLKRFMLNEITLSNNTIFAVFFEYENPYMFCFFFHFVLCKIKGAMYVCTFFPIEFPISIMST